ncbi:MAG: patatin-like phospholipase family protein [Bacteroidota bacterium]
MAKRSSRWTLLWYSLPVQILLTHFKRNQLMVLGWVVLLAMVTGNFGKYLGIPYLFLDPEYLDSVGFRSFFILGLVTAGYAAAHNITSYITEGHRYAFIGTLPRPFTKFALNNSILPLVFIAVFVFQVIGFQANNEFSDVGDTAWKLAGFFSGLFLLTALLYLYFHFTQKDIFRYLTCKIDEKLKHRSGIARASAMRKRQTILKKQVRVDCYLDYDFRLKKVEADTGFYDRQTILQVFDQNHFNLVAIELTLFALILILGIMKDVPAFQLPAGASFMIFLTVFVMIAGAFGYWFGGWSGTASLALFLVVNHLVGKDFFSHRYEAFGLDYRGKPVEYSVANLRNMHDTVAMAEDEQLTITQLERWRSKFGPEPPKMAMICVSGGGKRAALWTLAALQTADSLTGGKLYDHSVLITGASGGLIGASYYRELRERQRTGEQVRPWSDVHRRRIAADNLNPLIFSLLANDLFVGFTRYEYGGNVYRRDRAYTFEDQLNEITGGTLDKPMGDYRALELSGQAPLILFTPTIVNDGRKLYIASRSVTFMNEEVAGLDGYANVKIGGVDFNRLFAGKQPERLRVLSALRMSATFPYITPNTTLPTEPQLLIMDAGISDNFGLSDAVRFLYVFRKWIAENTSGVLLVSVRDSPKIRETSPKEGLTIMDELTQPISSVNNNFENFQDINSDLLLSHARSWFGGTIERVDLEYQATAYLPILQKMDSIRQNSARASLSWRLTTREKRGVVANLSNPGIREKFSRIGEVLADQ